ncbi:MAG TPA: 1-acyl-sn-glycerol-3-phosphate acyltransferase, partial [Candidatus Acidoferrales bacterium]
IIAAANLVSFVGVFLAAGVYFLLAENMHLHADKIFFAGACMTLAATFYAVVLLPDSLLRLALWTLTHTLYRIRVQGRDNIPERGGALFVAGRLTLLDAVLLSASTDRRIRFLVSQNVGENSGARPSSFAERVLRITRFPMESVQAKLEHLKSVAAAAFRADEVVCLAGEQSIALLSEDYPKAVDAARGVAEFLVEAGAPIVPVSLVDTQGGALCGEEGRIFWEMPSRVPCKVKVRFGPPLSPTLRPVDLRRAFAAFASQGVSHAAPHSIPPVTAAPR